MATPRIVRRIKVLIYLHPIASFLAATWLTLFAYGTYDGWNDARADEKIVEQSLEFIHVGERRGEWFLYMDCEQSGLAWTHSFDSNRLETDFTPTEGGAITAGLKATKRLASSDGFRFAAAAVLGAGAAESWGGRLKGFRTSAISRSNSSSRATAVVAVAAITVGGIVLAYGLGYELFDDFSPDCGNQKVLNALSDLGMRRALEVAVYESEFEHFRAKLFEWADEESESDCEGIAQEAAKESGFVLLRSSSGGNGPLSSTTQLPMNPFSPQIHRQFIQEGRTWKYVGDLSFAMPIRNPARVAKRPTAANNAAQDEEAEDKISAVAAQARLPRYTMTEAFLMRFIQSRNPFPRVLRQCKNKNSLIELTRAKWTARLRSFPEYDSDHDVRSEDIDRIYSQCSKAEKDLSSSFCRSEVGQ